jgi:multiple sugar transport system ATP-binding protein
LFVQGKIVARISLQNVSKIYDGKINAVLDFDLDIADGELMVIVGPSGCGKTTTLRLIAGLEKPATGNIYIGDTIVDDISPKLRDVAMVFQNYALYPHMTVYQNMAFSLKMRKMPTEQIKKRVKEIAGLLGMEHSLNRRPKSLSGGQRQRVALGRAIVRNPKVFLFDEPLSNLDSELRVTMRTKMKDLHNRLQTTSVYVTHDQTEAMTMGERICVMNNGKIQQVADPIEIYERPANKFVAGFFGTPAMNFFPGCLKCSNETISFVMDKSIVTLPKSLKTGLSNYHNKEIVLGVRPENLSLHQFPGQVNNSISGTVNVVEPVGIRTDVHLRGDNGWKFIVCINPCTKLKTNDVVNIYIDLDKIHFFESDKAGKNIATSGSKLA